MDTAGWLFNLSLTIQKPSWGWAVLGTDIRKFKNNKHVIIAFWLIRLNSATFKKYISFNKGPIRNQLKKGFYSFLLIFESFLEIHCRKISFFIKNPYLRSLYNPFLCKFDGITGNDIALQTYNIPFYCKSIWSYSDHLCVLDCFASSWTRVTYHF